ncbi:MAG: hypothetical protein KME20_22690 [Kaiparowitsia implicata GSE-PSE-MK54-09C]|jgi:hypothetical protein|nr:hypothetical protein [Kaiparowitsia implicata GSE-PSE-MK54-09C]
MNQDGQPHSEWVKFVYNAQFPAATTGIVLNYTSPQMMSLKPFPKLLSSCRTHV